MSVRLLETVPNISEGRDRALVRELADAMETAGAAVLDVTADADHNRAVITAVGAPAAIEEAGLAVARVAAERIDLRRHEGVHPRIGALDVLPFVPLAGLTLEAARASAHRVGRRIANEVGVPVFYYAHASEPRGRTLAELRRGGFEALARGWPEDRRPDECPPDWTHPGAHPSAGAICVGARRVLLAWNVFVSGVAFEELRSIARGLRETGGGFKGLRALALELPARGATQLSMNLEDVETASPLDVFRRIEAEVEARGGRIERTEVIGLVPDRLVLDAAADRLRLETDTTARLLSARLFNYLVE